MTIEAEIEQQLAALQDRYGEVPVEEEHPPFELPPERFRTFVNAAEAGTLNASYVWVRRSQEQVPDAPTLSEAAEPSSERVLLIYNRADDHTWTVPGGGQEPGLVSDPVPPGDP